MTNRRRARRQRSLLGGTVVFGGRNCAMDCLVRNISETGAMIAFAQSAVTPRAFALHIPKRQQTYSAEVVWRGGDRAGLALRPIDGFAVDGEAA